MVVLRLCLCMALAVFVGCETYVGVRRSAPIVGNFDGGCVSEALEYVGALNHVEHRVRVKSPHPPWAADGLEDHILYTTHGHAVSLVFTRFHDEGTRYISQVVVDKRDNDRDALTRVRSVMGKVEQVMRDECGVEFAAPVAEECNGFRCVAE